MSSDVSNAVLPNSQSSQSDVAIRVVNLGKSYRIYEKPEHRLWQGLFRGHRQFFREFWALKGVSFEVKKGETVGIIGVNGSGKSTLLQLVCGTVMPSSGQIELKGRVAALLELGAGFNPEFTGRENLYMNASILGLKRHEIDARYDRIVAFAEIGDFIDQPVKTYSSGMFLRLAFAVVAHVDADILVIDEALAVGDALFNLRCMRFLRDFMKKGTILFVSHDTAAVVSLCRRAIWLDRGSIRMSGTAKEVTEAYLETLYQKRQGPEHAMVDEERHQALRHHAQKDQRLAFINHTQYRNDIQLVQFSPDGASFGTGGARIISVSIMDEQGDSLAWTVGGETVALEVIVEFRQPVSTPIVGFYVKDRLGQQLFGDNTYLTYLGRPVRVNSGSRLSARFEFSMPVLPAGDYSVCVAVAEGTQEEHVQHHWIHDVLLLRSQSSSVCTGLIGIPMRNIEMKLIHEDALQG